MSENIKHIQHQLGVLHLKSKQITRNKWSLLNELADPEKNKKLYEIAQILYKSILDTEVNDDLDQKTFTQDVLNTLKEEDLDFFTEHKHDNFYKSTELFKLYQEHEIQKCLNKSGYIGIRIIKKANTLNQVLNYLIDAKIRHHKDNLIQELKSLRVKEELRYTLFEQEGFNQITDFNERECLLMIKSNHKLKDKEMMEKLNIPRTNWYRYKKKFTEMGLI